LTRVHYILLIVGRLLCSRFILKIEIRFANEVIHIATEMARQIFADANEFALAILEIDGIRNVVHKRIEKIFFFFKIIPERCKLTHGAIHLFLSSLQLFHILPHFFLLRPHFFCLLL
jgi:hypothetical protein